MLAGKLDPFGSVILKQECSEGMLARVGRKSGKRRLQTASPESKSVLTPGSQIVHNVLSFVGPIQKNCRGSGIGIEGSCRITFYFVMEV